MAGVCLVGLLPVFAVFVGLRSEWLNGAVASALGGLLGAVVVGAAAGGFKGFLAGALVGPFYAAAVFLGVWLVGGLVYAVRTGQWRKVRCRRTV